MLQIRCTKKVLDAIGIKQKDLDSIKEADSLLGNWYANLFSIDRRKIIIFMNEKTLFSFIIIGVRKDNIKKIIEIFCAGLEQILILEGIDAAKIEEVLAEYDDVEFTKTENRSVIGNLNELVNVYKCHISYDEGLKYCDLTEIIYRINRMPQRNINWEYSVDALNELLEVDRCSGVIEPNKIKEDSTVFPSHCLSCHKSKPGIVDKNCHLCLDKNFQEEMLCDLNRSVQERLNFECKAFRPMLKLVGTENSLSAEPVLETEEESLLQSEFFKYKKAHALQRLKGNPDEEIVCLKYHFVWNTIQRKPFFKDIGKDADKINLLFEDVGAESDVVAGIMFLAADHIHMYMESDGEKSVDSLVKEIKANSRRRLLSEFGKLFDKSADIWDEAYFVETIA